MTVKTEKPGSPAFYREVVNTSVQYGRLLKKPDRKLSNMFFQYMICTVLCAVMLAVELFLGILWGFDALTVTGAVFIGVLCLFCALLLRSLHKTLRSLQTDFSPSVFTLDDQGVELAKENASTVRTAWSGIAFVRVLPHSVCFVARQPMRYLMHVDKEYAAGITAWLAEHRPEIRLIHE